MADDFSVDFRNQRNGHGDRFAQSMDDKLFRLPAVRTGPEGGFGDGRYDGDVGGGFWSDGDVHKAGM
jgi:hypothetical protein